MEYNFKELEPKWQQRWRERGTYHVEVDPARPKYYVLDMFPYPSGAGLHVGHPLGYIASDIFSRYKRQCGFNVLHPMGYDAFGLPAEQYAIQTGQHPAVTTEHNIARYREQLDKIQQQSEYKDVRDIKVIDPCMGSGHILVYAFDVLMQMYEDAGYNQRDAAKSILENNLYGLDIDDRAYQLAYFAVMMKARQYNRRILNGETTCQVYAIQESNNINRTHLKYLGAGMDDLEVNTARVQVEGLLDTLRDAKEYGSILKVESYNWELLRRFVSAADAGDQVTLDSAGLEVTVAQLLTLIDIAETIAQKYDVVVTNPPYMAISNGDARLNEYVKKNYPDSKADLFAVFIECCSAMTEQNRYQAMITQHSWMFLSSFEKLRKKLLRKDTINMAHLGPRAFEEIGGEVVQTTSFVMRKSHVAEYKGTYCRLIDPPTQRGKEDMFLAGKNRYTAQQSNFSKIPGSPVAYWVSDLSFQCFAAL